MTHQSAHEDALVDGSANDMRDDPSRNNEQEDLHHAPCERTRQRFSICSSCCLSAQRNPLPPQNLTARAPCGAIAATKHAAYTGQADILPVQAAEGNVRPSMPALRIGPSAQEEQGVRLIRQQQGISSARTQERDAAHGAQL